MQNIHPAPLRIAFIGGATTSAVGYTHFTASRLDGICQLVAGSFSRDEHANWQSALIYGVPAEHNYLDWRELLRKEKGHVDAIVVLTPTPSHKEIVISALKAGYAVVCEKALCISSEECKCIQEALNQTKGYLAVTFNYSGYPMVRELRHMIHAGHLGDLQQIHIEMPQETYLRRGANPQPWRRQDHTVPTVSLDLGVHVHHLIDFITSGAQPLEIAGDEVSYGKFTDITDNAYCLAQYEKKIRVQAWWGKTALGYRNGLRIRAFGSHASAEWLQTDSEALLVAHNNGKIQILDRSVEECSIASKPRYNRFKPGHPSGFIEAFANLYSDIADDIREHKAGRTPKNPFVLGIKHAHEGMVFLEAAHQASVEKKWISIKSK